MFLVKIYGNYLLNKKSITSLSVILAVIACYPPFNTVDEITQKK